ncbi:MAG: HD domain-containing protein [Blautia sp.]|nr:HD domain-containing protein [Blautia sp.]
MGRLKDLRKEVNRRLDQMEDAEAKMGAAAHLYGVSLSATLLAKKRGVDVELASMAAMLHDLYAYEKGTYEDHAHQGAILAREVLDKLSLTTEEETEAICHAIYCHDSKAEIDGPLDEVLKDADVCHHCFSDTSKAVKEKEKARYDALVLELGL